MCSNVCLAHLTLLGNSIARLKYYRTSVASRLPQLKFLDDKEISNSERSRLTNTEECIIDEKYITAENRKLKAFEIVSSHSNRSLFSTPTSISPPIGSNSVSNSECLSGGSSRLDWPPSSSESSLRLYRSSCSPDLDNKSEYSSNPERRFNNSGRSPEIHQIYHQRSSTSMSAGISGVHHPLLIRPQSALVARNSEANNREFPYRSYLPRSVSLSSSPSQDVPPISKCSSLSGTKTDDDSMSELTFGNSEIMCGNPIQALRRRRRKTCEFKRHVIKS
eukprot:928556_1